MGANNFSAKRGTLKRGEMEARRRDHEALALLLGFTSIVDIDPVMFPMEPLTSAIILVLSHAVSALNCAASSSVSRLLLLPIHCVTMSCLSSTGSPLSLRYAYGMASCTHQPSRCGETPGSSTQSCNLNRLRHIVRNQMCP